VSCCSRKSGRRACPERREGICLICLVIRNSLWFSRMRDQHDRYPASASFAPAELVKRMTSEAGFYHVASGICARSRRQPRQRCLSQLPGRPGCEQFLSPHNPRLPLRRPVTGGRCTLRKATCLSLPCRSPQEAGGGGPKAEALPSPGRPLNRATSRRDDPKDAPRGFSIRIGTRDRQQSKYIARPL
jgi:hypothetical protein